VIRVPIRPPVPREEDFRSRLRSPAVAARVGLWLGVCFGLAFVTGLISHYAQQPHQPVPFPTSPSWGYRVTQGLHVIAGTAAVPLLLVKLWTVFPKLLARPPRRAGELLVHGLERVSIGVLVASAIFQLASGLANTAQWYPWHFHFRATHYALAWVAIGALLVHIAVKLPLIRAVLGADVDSDAHDRPGLARTDGVMSRRGLLRTTGGAVGIATLATAGISVPWLRRVSVLGVRSGHGPQGVPVNTSAVAARVVPAATSASYALTVRVGDRAASYSLADLQAMPQSTVSLPIACVEGWRERRSRRDRELAAAVRTVPVHDLAGELRRRRPHPGRAPSRRRDVVDRPRLPLSADRTGPPGRAADEVAGLAGGGGMTRASVLGLGLAAAAYGVVLLLMRGWANLWAAVTWLVGGVVLHDAVLAPLTILVAWAALRVLGPRRTTPWAVGLVLLGPVTLLAVPVLGRYGARPDNPSLLDRSYGVGWSALVVLVVLGLLIATFVTRRRRAGPTSEGGARGQGDGGR
jgi:hypothetical protein